MDLWLISTILCRIFWERMCNTGDRQSFSPQDCGNQWNQNKHTHTHTHTHTHKGKKEQIDCLFFTECVIMNVCNVSCA